MVHHTQHKKNSVEDDNGHIPSAEAITFLDKAERLEASFAPLPCDYYYKPGDNKKPPKKKKKQLTLKQAVKNMTKPPVNFQGMPLNRCTVIPELDGTPVFMHGNYEKAWKKQQKKPHFFCSKADSKCCPECFLQPCSARLLESELACDACTIQDIIKMSEEEFKEKLRRVYRAKLAKLQGKRLTNRLMPTNCDIPLCAKKITAKIASVEFGGCDSLLDDESNVPFPNIKKRSEKLMGQPSDGEESEDSAEEEEWNCPFGNNGLVQSQGL